MGNHKTGTLPALMTKEQAAEYLSVSTATIERLTYRGKLPVTKMPGTGTAGRPRNMYSRAALDDFIDRHTGYVRGEDDFSIKPVRGCSSRKSATQALREVEGLK